VASVSVPPVGSLLLPPPHAASARSVTPTRASASRFVIGGPFFERSADAHGIVGGNRDFRPGAGRARAPDASGATPGGAAPSLVARFASLAAVRHVAAVEVVVPIRDSGRRRVRSQSGVNWRGGGPGGAVPGPSPRSCVDECPFGLETWRDASAGWIHAMRAPGRTGRVRLLDCPLRPGGRPLPGTTKGPAPSRRSRAPSVAV